MKCSNQSRKSSLVIYPEGLQLNTDPFGGPFFNASCMRARGKITYGGRCCPVADMHITAVVETPLSPEVIDPTCFFPFLAAILSFFGGT